jgi:long-chain fatty acid transport protein
VSVVIVAAGILCLPAISDGAGLAVPGIGIKARSMGGAFRGLADDWSAVEYNPAGLARLDRSEINVVTLGIYNPRVTYNPNVSSGPRDIGFGQASGLDHYPIDDLWPQLSMAGIAVNPEWEGFVFGAAVYWPHDVNYAWDLYRQPLGYNTDYEFPKRDVRTDFDVLDIHPTAALVLSDKLSVGAGLSLTNADLVLRRTLFVDNELGGAWADYPFNQFVGDFRLEGNGFSIGANAGLMWQASENVSVGISGKTPIGITLNGRAHLTMAWPQNRWRTELNDGIAVTEDGDSVRTPLFFSGVNDPLVRQDNTPQSTSTYEMDIDLPAQLGVGIGWKTSDKLTLAFDAAMTFWSSIDAWTIKLDGDGLNGGTKRITEVPISMGWKDQIRISGGFEYLASDLIALRGGAYYDQGAAPDSTFNPNFPNDGDALGITGGLAYAVDAHWQLAYAQEIAFYSKRTVEPTDGSISGVTVFPGDYSQTRWESIFAINYRF